LSQSVLPAMTLCLRLVFLAGAVLLGQALDGTACVDETKAFSTMTGGYLAGAWPRLIDHCGKASVNLISGINEHDFSTCLALETNLSRSCVRCFWSPVQYGFENCKMACIGSWCSSSCLNCVAPARPAVAACAGFPGPPALQCDDVPANMTGAENVMQFLMRLMQGARKYSSGKQIGSSILHPAFVGPVAFIGFGFVCFGIVSFIRRKMRHAEHRAGPAAFEFLEEQNEEGNE